MVMHNAPMPGDARGPGTRGPADAIVDAVLGSPLAPATEGEGGADGRRFSVYDHIRTPPDRRSLRELPRLVTGSLRLTWRAGPAALVVSGLLQLLAGIGVAAQLLVARRFLDEVIAAEHSGRSFGDVVPAMAVLGGISVFLALAATIQSEISGFLGELMSRQASREIIDVACAVDLEAYEIPAFHDRLERARLTP